MKVFIHPGHGGNDPGAIGPTGLKEKDVTLHVALKLAIILKDLGFEAVLARDRDMSIKSYDAVVMANNARADLLISIHCNSATNPMATGTETFYSSPKSKPFAEAAQKKLVKNLQLTDRGIKTGNFSIISKAKMPAILAELAFINNPVEEKLLRNNAFLDRAVQGLLEGIIEFLGGEKMIKVKIKGKSTNVRGIFLNGVNYASIRDIAEMLGHKVGWDPATGTVTIE